MKAALISIDALDIEDLDVFSHFSSLARVLRKGQVIRSMAVTPAQTYPCHASILSGFYPEKTEIIDNLSHPSFEWQFWRESIKTKILTDYAKENGLSTASVCFPVTAGADIDYLVPEIWTKREGDDADPVFKSASSEKGYEYYLRHKEKLDWMRTPGMDIFASNVFISIIKEQRPDLALLHLSYLDHQKHMKSPRAKDIPYALSFIEELMEKVLEVLDDYEIFIVGDHGHRKQIKGIVFGDDSRIILHPTGMTAEIYLDGISEAEAKQKLEAIEGVKRVYEMSEFESLHLPKSFSLFAVADEGYAFSLSPTPAGHGYVGEEGPYPPFIAFNVPYALKKDTCSLVDIAPTILKTFGIEMDADGCSLI